jgi:large subunit ribosomal protein L3
MKMAGHHGNSKVTVENLEIVKIDQANNQMLVKGAVPGAKNGTVIISK